MARRRAIAIYRYSSAESLIRAVPAAAAAAAAGVTGGKWHFRDLPMATWLVMSVAMFVTYALSMLEPYVCLLRPLPAVRWYF